MENPNDIVCVTSGNFELGGATVPVRSFDLLRYKGRIKEESFRDAFDGGTYTSEIVRLDEKGDKNFVKL